MLPGPLAAAALLCLSAAALAADGDLPPGGTIADMDLSRPFGLPPGWRFVATQAPPVEDPLFGAGGKVPGPIRLCAKRPDGSCSPALAERLMDRNLDPAFAEFHDLRRAAIVYPFGKGRRPLLLVQTGSTWSGDGDMILLTQLLYRAPGTPDFRRVFTEWTGHNNNQEVRYIESGPLRGDVISAVPTGNAPFGFWIAVNAPSSSYAYRQVLRYRSATIYGDGNPLGVIDSEMPSIRRRLGLWHAGMPLPAPPHCAKPHLVRTELWCS